MDSSQIASCVKEKGLSAEGVAELQGSSNTAPSPYTYFNLVGKNKKGEDCGDVVPCRSCQTCIKWHFVKKSCMQKGCPNCYKKWIKGATGKIGKRLLSKNSSKRLLHIAISPSPELAEGFLKKLKEIQSYQEFYPPGQFKELFQYHFALFKGFVQLRFCAGLGGFVQV